MELLANGRVSPMSYLADLHREHVERRARLTCHPAPTAPKKPVALIRTVGTRDRGFMAIPLADPKESDELGSKAQERSFFMDAGNMCYPVDVDMRPKPSMRAILSSVSAISDLSIYLLKGRTKIAPIAIPRQVFFYISRLYRYSYPVIGHQVDRDPTTVMHAFNVVSRAIFDQRCDDEKSNKFKTLVAEVIANLSAKGYRDPNPTKSQL